jgi:hypothetical protein
VIAALPEIIADSEHPRAVEHLMQTLRESRDLAAPLIDALSDLTVPACVGLLLPLLPPPQAH